MMAETKLNDCVLVNHGSGSIRCDQQQIKEVKKTALRDLQNGNIMVSPQNAAKRGSTDAVTVSGTKRPTPECVMGPPCHLSPSSNGTIGNHVYIRRKSEQEVEKSNTCDKMENNADCLQSKPFNHGTQVTPRQQTPLQGTKNYSAFAYPGASIKMYSPGGASIPLSLGKAVNVPSADLNRPSVASGSSPANSQWTSDQHFKERFLRLQAFLKSYDNSSHEEYTQMLRALTSVGRSRHAVELEKRAIHLLLEEKKELERMKDMNVLGKATPKKNSSPSPTQTPSGK
ncbi:Integral membrane protein hemolysin-III, putative isoform [Thalictrum thalictroides]|uniref:Integral membrane protein hemolysin-III, putative isoform n=1 Tax=Thalictrum thalictroides TaxID=46969 RepID=A0A7J6XCF3_THATH|nr:Integral membrane protein hemolysin-III, putative isoform [Thalictrum thalictroides]